MTTLAKLATEVDDLDSAAGCIPPRRPRAWLDLVAVAVLACGVSAAGAARPSLWFDEAATISAASGRSVPQLWGLLGHIDAVHGLYYLIMHGWFVLVAPTEFWSRVPSMLAVGVAAAGTVALGKQLSTRAVAICGGIVFAVLPRITWAGIEARSYAFTVALAVWLTVLCVAAVRRDRTGLWIGYGLLLPIAPLLNIYLVLLIPVHAVVVFSLPRRRSAVRWWAATSLLAAALVTPFAVFCQTQIAQVGWISPLNAHSILDVVQQQYFDLSVPFSLLAATAILAAEVLRRRRATPTAPTPTAQTRRLVVIAVAWMAIPTAIIVAYSALMSPILYPRYLCFTSPAMALLLGVCIVAVGRKPIPIACMLAAFAVAAVPNYLYVQRGPYAKGQMDFSQVADVITAHSRPGDCLLLDNTTAWKPGPIRPLLAARPAAYRQLVDPGRGAAATTSNRLWDGFVPIFAITDRVKRCRVLWTISERDATLADHSSGSSLAPGPRLGRAPVYQVPHKFGFHLVERWQFSFAQVTKSVR